jgi:putative ABC transport system permease protein
MNSAFLVLSFLQISQAAALQAAPLQAAPLQATSAQSTSAQSASAQSATIPGIAIDERLAADAGLGVGDTVLVSADPNEAGEQVIIAAITRRGADPAEIARSEYRVRLHLPHLQRLSGTPDRVDRFAVATRNPEATERALERINAVAFGFQPHLSSDIAVETSRTFQVVSRFHRAIGVITIAASAIFLLCIMLLRVEERRRDVAAMRLIGLSRASVARAVVLEAALLALVGSVMGGVLGWLISLVVDAHYQGVYRTPLRFAIVTAETMTFAVILSLVLGLLAGGFVAWRLVRTPPLQLFGR